jgi:hypothetical protein
MRVHGGHGVAERRFQFVSQRSALVSGRPGFNYSVLVALRD